MNIRNRIIEVRKVKLGDLRPHPLNFRVHPGKQRDVLTSIMSEVGFAGVPIARKLPDGSLQLLDGHMRRELVGDALVDVAITDLDDDEAAKLLATYDAVGDLASTDDAILEDLLSSVESEEGDLGGLLDELAGKISETTLTDISEETKMKPPVMTWVTIGIPTIHYGDIAETIQAIANHEHTRCEIRVTSDEGRENED